MQMQCRYRPQPRFTATLQSTEARARAEYYIEPYPDEHDYAVFAVVHRDDEKPRAETSRGKSFALYCDRRTFRVIKEMWFQ